MKSEKITFKGALGENLSGRIDMPPSILIGHSPGGAAVLQDAHKITSSKAVVTIDPPSDPKHVEKHFESHKEEIEKKGEAVVKLAGWAEIYLNRKR